MNKGILIATVGAIFIGAFSCKEKTTNPPAQPPITFSYESSSCLRGLPKKSLADSTFVYSFGDTLVLDFSVRANCCPDSNRFRVSWLLSGDTIVVAVADTAENLCRCWCPYMIHTEVAHLPNDHYVVRCTIDNYFSAQNPIHLVNVYRSR